METSHQSKENTSYAFSTKPGGVRRTFKFYFDEKQREFTDKYKYLGCFLDESMSFLHGTSVLADSAGQPLRGVIGKTKLLEDLSYSTYFKLYQTRLCPV